MTIEHIKESLSGYFTGILASNKGYRIDKGDLDYGVDFQVKRNITYSIGGVTRITQDSRYIDIQLKCTTENSIIIGDDGFLKYDLEVKNYNDLITRKVNGIVPLILILVVLPSEQNQWVALNQDGILIRRSAYWYLPDDNLHTNNISTKRVFIPIQNQLNLECFDSFYSDFYPT